jgi:hypothetical protein
MKNDMGVACSTYGGRGVGDVYGVLVGKSEGKRELLRRLRWEDNIKMVFQNRGIGGHELDWSASGYGQVAGSCEWGNETSGWGVS